MSPNRQAGLASSEPVRSQWTPKMEHIQILENIFNSGTVNLTKDKTIKIRKILEQYGSVGDANVFYWFQNRRTRSCRHQRQLQAAAAAAGAYGHHGSFGGGPDGSVLYEPTLSGSSSSSNSSGGGFLSYCASSSSSSSMSPGFVGEDGYVDDLLVSISRQMGFAENGHNPYLYSNSDASQLQYQSSE